MKEKILQMLRTKYSNLGLGDEILTAQAEALEKLGLVTEENIETVVNGLETSLKAIQKANDKERTAKAKAEQEKKELEEKLKNQKPIEKEQPKEESKYLTKEDITALFKERDEAEIAKKQAQTEQEVRSKFISEKAKELGIPEWRINEGFVIGQDFDNDKITEYLTGVSKNITTAGLETVKGFPIDHKQKVTKEEADNIAKSLIN